MAHHHPEQQAYEALEPQLEVGRWVVVKDGHLIGTFESYDSAAQESLQRFGPVDCLIRQVGPRPEEFGPHLVVEESTCR